MHTKEVFYRGKKLGHEDRMLPAVSYNAMRTLLAYSDLDNSESSGIFLPIRSMQYMAVIDQQEIIFVDGLCAKKSIELAWRKFHPQQRENLIDPVPYRMSYYDEKALETMKRIQWEFNKALQVELEKMKDQYPKSKADVITLNTYKT
ncbi:hypothetical protein GCM10009133_18550 [Cocleimonas flava]|uniref:Uncharacterized protein n=1 Tax=Cocleimonas flava TaxID=634765 RepID=A0A4R1EY16_9GAMM|nr:hypothetical protein [Cocleimonas flava]TCJ84779.1 hypothetical protein EV695_2740 [Cocleimonas flava]